MPAAPRSWWSRTCSGWTASSADFLRFLLTRMAAERRRRRGDGPDRRAWLPDRGYAAWSASWAGSPPVRRLDLQPLEPRGGRAAPGRGWWRAGGRAHRRRAAGVRRKPVLREGSGRPSGTVVTCGRPGRPAGKQARRALARGARRGPAAPRSSRDLVPDRLLRHVSGLPDEVFDSAVREAVADGVLRPDGAGFRFAHDLVRSAVSDDLLPGERARLHGRVADSLQSGAGRRGPRGGGRPPRRRGPGRAASSRVVDPGGRRGDAGLGTGRGDAPLRPGALGLAGSRRRGRGRGLVRGPGRVAGDPGCGSRR